MKEVEYILATNLAKVKSARNILRDVLPGDLYGVTREEWSDLVVRLTEAEERLYGLVSEEE